LRARRAEVTILAFIALAASTTNALSGRFACTWASLLAHKAVIPIFASLALLSFVPRNVFVSWLVDAVIAFASLWHWRSVWIWNAIAQKITAVLTSIWTREAAAVAPFSLVLTPTALISESGNRIMFTFAFALHFSNLACPLVEQPLRIFRILRAVNLMSL